MHVLKAELKALYTEGFKGPDGYWWYVLLLFVSNDLMGIPRLTGGCFPSSLRCGCVACRHEGVPASISLYPSGCAVKPGAVAHLKRSLDEDCVLPVYVDNDDGDVVKATHRDLILLYKSRFPGNDAMSTHMKHLADEGGVPAHWTIEELDNFVKEYDDYIAEQLTKNPAYGTDPKKFHLVYPKSDTHPYSFVSCLREVPVRVCVIHLTILIDLKYVLFEYIL